MTISLPSLFAGLLALALQTPTPTPAVTPKPAAQTPPTQTPAAQTSTAARPGALILTIQSERGEPLAGASVAVHGPVDRAGTSGPDGTLTLQNMPVGAYRCRITRDGFITLEKEVAVKTAARTNAEASLSVAPPPPPPPSPSPTPTPENRPMTPAGVPGSPKVLSIPDLAEQMLKDSAPTVDRQLGCSGVTETTLVVARENVAAHQHADMDELLYLVAGEATLTIDGKDQNIMAGWYGLVPRGMSHALTRKGRNPIVFLLVHSGKPCSMK
jgi:mannose-6-phosphate isomerase-like protein (cupin superfamily)